MPPVVAAAAIAAGGAIAGGAIQSRAAGKAAKAQTQASNYAADRQTEASERTERFQREQAQREWEAQEADRRANYDQWAAREQRLGSIAERLGYGKRNIPGYVPGVNPNMTTGGPRASMTWAGQPGSPTQAGIMPGKLPYGSMPNTTPQTPGGVAPGWDRTSSGPTSSPQIVGDRFTPTRRDPVEEATYGGWGGRTSRGQTPYTPPTVRDALLARRFPPGSVEARLLAARRRPAGAGV